MQSLKFLGNGSGFTFGHTNAFFETENKIVLIDISMVNLEKFLSIKPYLKDTYVVITHMHPDHVSGLAMLIQWYYYKFNKKLTVLCKCNELLLDLNDFLRLQGISSDIYNIKNNISSLDCILDVINTEHAPELKNCYSYIFNVNGRKILYTGDTNTLRPYKDKEYDEIYIDVSVTYGGVHLKFDDVKTELIAMSEKAEVYIMHVDDMAAMKKLIIGTNIKIAEVI